MYRMACEKKLLTCIIQLVVGAGVSHDQRSAFYILLQLYLLVNNMHGKHASSLPYRTAFTASYNDNYSVLNEKTLLLSHLFLPLP